MQNNAVWAGIRHGGKGSFPAGLISHLRQDKEKKADAPAFFRKILSHDLKKTYLGRFFNFLPPVILSPYAPQDGPKTAPRSAGKTPGGGTTEVAAFSTRPTTDEVGPRALPPGARTASRRPLPAAAARLLPPTRAGGGPGWACGDVAQAGGGRARAAGYAAELHHRSRRGCIRVDAVWEHVRVCGRVAARGRGIPRLGDFAESAAPGPSSPQVWTDGSYRRCDERSRYLSAGERQRSVPWCAGRRMGARTAAGAASCRELP